MLTLIGFGMVFEIWPSEGKKEIFLLVCVCWEGNWKYDGNPNLLLKKNILSLFLPCIKIALSVLMVVTSVLFFTFVSSHFVTSEVFCFVP